MVIQISWIIFSMFIWFNTDALISYSLLFKVDRYFKIDQWIDYRIINPRVTYLDFLRLKYSNFFTKLVSCKPCLCFWITFIVCVIFGSLNLYPLYYLSSYIIYTIINKYLL